MITISTIYSFSEKGIRDNNEDAIYPPLPSIDNRFFIVCDGMGGHENGEVASVTVSQSMVDYLHTIDGPIQSMDIQNALAFSIERLNEVDTGNNEKKMGTTIVLAVLNENEIIVGHAGDSRLYHIRPNEGILFQTKDHSKVQEWIDAEIITKEEARVHPKRNIITRCVQPQATDIRLEINRIENIKTGDYLFLCSDGVTDTMTNEELVELISQDCLDSDKIENIKNVCQTKSKDNYTAILINLESDLEPIVEYKEDRPEEKIIKERSYNCPSCHEELHIDTRFCLYCGAAIKEDENNLDDLELKDILTFTQDHLKIEHKIVENEAKNNCNTCYIRKVCAWIDEYTKKIRK